MTPDVHPAPSPEMTNSGERASSPRSHCRRVTGLAAAALAVTLTVTVAGCGTPQVAGVDAAAARAAIHDTAEALADASTLEEYEAWCAEWAADRTMCLHSLDLGIRVLPDTLTLGTRIRYTPSGGVVFTVSGLLNDGEQFTSDVEVVRDGDLARAVDPVYWIPRHIKVAVPTTHP